MTDPCPCTWWSTVMDKCLLLTTPDVCAGLQEDETMLIDDDYFGNLSGEAPVLEMILNGTRNQKRRAQRAARKARRLAT